LGKKQRQQKQDQYMYVSKNNSRKHDQQSKSKIINLIPRSRRQEAYIDALTNESKLIVLASGPAGTGKTMLGLLAGIKAYKSGLFNKIILTRPAVGVDDEKHGFLPGDLNQKMEPWTRPLFDVFHEYYSPTETAKMLEDQIIEISPLAFMRGRTFKNAWIVADEMQNATPNQMKMLLTRLGEGSKIVVTGDIRQTDKKEIDNGLLDFSTLVERYEHSKFVEGIQFQHTDIERHPAVVEVLSIYGDKD